MNRNAIHGRLVGIGAGVLSLILLGKLAIMAITRNEPLNRFRRALTERQEQRSESDEFGDYSLFISGRLPETRFKEMSELLGLIGKSPEKPGQGVGWQIPDNLPWWVLPERFDEECHDHGEGYSVLLGRSGDRVFYQAISW